MSEPSEAPPLPGEPAAGAEKPTTGSVTSAGVSVSHEPARAICLS
jgi:hypothetical protein